MLQDRDLHLTVTGVLEEKVKKVTFLVDNVHLIH